MRKIIHLFLAIFVLIISISSTVLAQWVVKDWEDWIADTSNPVDLLKRVHYEANDDDGSKVQVTPLNHVSSKAGSDHCDIVITDSRFTLTKTLCSIKYYIKDYLQYIMYIWLTGATIFIIRNGFRIVMATDKEKQIWIFKKNMINLIIWVILLTSFYFILDVFVSVVNFIAWD